MKADPDSKVRARELCKVIFPYEGQNEDELTIKEGEIVTIINRECADAGWWMGEIGGRQGVFPDNFVKLLIPEVEKERPKKPPPPSAPSSKLTTGEEVKVGDIPKPALPSVPPKKPLPPKTGSASSSSSSLPPRRPDRPERPPTLQCESPKSEGGASIPESNSDKSHDIDVDLDAIVSSAEKLNHPTAMRPRITDRRPRSQIFSTVSLSSLEIAEPSGCEAERKERGKEEKKEKEKGKEEKKENERGKGEQDSPSSRPTDVSRRKGIPTISVPDVKSTLPSKPAVLPPPSSITCHRPTSPSTRSPSPSPVSPSPDARHLSSPSLEELRGQLKELRVSVEMLKSQHRKEMKQLASELEEEKRIRISLQMEVEHIKKSLAK